MRVFAMGPGRCCSMTFAKACAHFGAFTSKHESRDKDLHPTYPDDHIESCWHSIWKLNWLTSRYPDALYVYLRRDRADVVGSWVQRPRMDLLAKGMLRKDLKTKKDRYAFAHNWYTFVVDLIHNYFRGTRFKFVVLNVPPTLGEWERFCTLLNVSRDEIPESFSEWKIKHNATVVAPKKEKEDGAGTN